MGVNSLPKTVTRQRRGCDLNPGPSAPESSALITRLPSHALQQLHVEIAADAVVGLHLVTEIIGGRTDYS